MNVETCAQLPDGRIRVTRAQPFYCAICDSLITDGVDNLGTVVCDGCDAELRRSRPAQTLYLADMQRQWITSAGSRKRHFTPEGLAHSDMPTPATRTTLCGRTLDVATAHYGATHAEACAVCSRKLLSC